MTRPVSAPDALCLGAISGTSVDGLDLAAVEIGEQGIALVASDTCELPGELRDALIRLGQTDQDLEAFGRADAQFGRFIGESILAFLERENLPKEKVQAIGSHGQTVRHRPDGPFPFTLQIGDPSLIAEIAGIPTVADFRRRDMAAGGQGAPLVPPFHAAIFASPAEPRAVLNIGGIGNLTVLARKPSDAPADERGAGPPPTGFDTGPGNALLDAWCQAQTGAAYDEDGRWAVTGEVHEALLGKLLNDPYLRRAPPKSTGKEQYNLAWLKAQLPAGLEPRHVQRTLLEFTARSIAAALSRWAPAVQRILVCGGGRRNAALLRRLADLADAPVETTDAHGWDGDAIEAAAFAWLAHQRLAAAPGNAPSVTGARGFRVLGGIYAAP